MHNVLFLSTLSIEACIAMINNSIYILLHTVDKIDKYACYYTYTYLFFLSVPLSKLSARLWWLVTPLNAVFHKSVVKMCKIVTIFC